ncbi:Sphingomyelin phosphodiesterase [Daldinia childiae]|uniref:Sphingomyelin phosphodiesterase n=1 Tax=Daldinia childiae TaxID=326645 RepID=UPI0014463813|nr:Sphingomyelin phosphodiesterase [Daldinia childiae]KAF3062433.1 Sphingomyelin phosphodiesterase [Daldinia childiae]
MRILSFFAVVSVVIGRGFTTYLDFNDGSQKVLTSGTAGRLQDGFDLSSIVASTGEDAQSPASCAACEAILLQLKLIAAAGDNFFIHSMTELCQRFHIEDADVCAGSIALEGPIVAHSLRGLAVGSRTSQLVCVALMGLCQHPEVLPYNVSFPSPRGLTGRPSPSGLEPVQVVHFSDIHVDPLYVEGANANCTKPICCREYTDVDKPGFNDFPAKRYGEHKCDSPASLEDSMYTAIQAVAPNAAFAIFTGDIVDHAVWDTSESQNALGIEDAYGRMAHAGLRVYGTAGNHEASPANSFPPTPANSDDNTDNNSNATQWLYDLLSATWSRWIGPRAAATTREFGAYSVQHISSRDGVGKLRVISLSTNMYYGHNYWLYEEPMQRDPSGQLAWLVGELDAAEKAGERVYIIGHMPMGSRDTFHDGSNYFDQIVRRYEGTIAAMFFGHTHFDEFELSYADNSNKSHSNALVTSYIAPSMTPISGHPAFRVYTVDPITFGVLDATTYIANVSDPSFSSPTGPKWTKYYSAREAYGPLIGATKKLESDTGLELEELTPAFWHNVTSAFERNETAFAEYFARRRRGWEVKSCDEKCRGAEICKMRAARAEDNCIPPGLRLNYNKNMGNGQGEEDECGDSIIRDTLESLVGDVNMLKLLGELVVARELL